MRMIALCSMALAACTSSNSQTTAEATESATAKAADEATVEQVATWVAAGEATPCDANGDETRAEHGTLPGAVLLSSYEEYSPSELPTDKSSKLVFYCSSTRCGAAPKAATMALKAGYTNVFVMREGIKGWVEKGHTTQPFTPKS